MLSLLNLNRKQNREEVYTVTRITGEKWQESHSSAAADQILKNGGQCVFWLFDKAVAFSKPLVDAITYKKMSAEVKAQNCTINTINTYLVVGELEDSEVKLADLREQMRVYKVNAAEFKRDGSIAVNHIRILAK
jgi:hypothetical protein